MTFGQYAENFFLWGICTWTIRQQGKDRGLSRESAQHRRGHLENYLKPEFKDVLLSDITAPRFEKWWMQLTLSNQTKNHIKYTMNIIMKEAKRERYIRTNPIEDVEPMGKNHQSRDALTLEELGKLFPKDMPQFRKNWPTSMYGVLFALMASSGLRPGEAQALRWKDVSWDGSGVLVYKALKGDSRKEGSTKTGSIRAVPVPERTLELLRWWREQVEHFNPEDRVFPTRNRRTVLYHFYRGCKTAKVNLDGRKIDVYALRHTYNTIMNDLLDEAYVMAFMGHQSKRMNRHYDHPELVRRLTKYVSVRKEVNRFWSDRKDGATVSENDRIAERHLETSPRPPTN